MTAPRLLAGASGYSFKEWKGDFYPEDIKADAMLAYYVARLPTVEINNTFYRMPKTSVLENWAATAPDGFRFAIKASRRITHFARLKAEALEPTAYMLSTLEALGPRLGAVLFQMPPNLAKDDERLTSFIDSLPATTPAAFEFRHESWNDARTHHALRDRDMALVCADTEESSDDEPIVRTASWGYLRLRRPDYRDADLARWAERVAGQGWERAYVFFKHEDEGAGPKLAARFRELFAG